MARSNFTFDTEEDDRADGSFKQDAVKCHSKMAAVIVLFK